MPGGASQARLKFDAALHSAACFELALWDGLAIGWLLLVLKAVIMRAHRSPTSQAGGPRFGGVLQQPRSRRETIFLLGIVAIASFFIWRLCQFGSGMPQASTFTAVLSTTQARPARWWLRVCYGSRKLLQAVCAYS